MTLQTPASVRSSTQAFTPLRVWFPVLASIAAACAVFGLIFWREIAGAVTVWVDSTAYNHCFLVLPLVGVLLWNRRKIIREMRPMPAPWFLGLIPFLSALWIAAALLEVQEIEQILVLLTFEVVLVSILGWKVFKSLLAPFLFLFFLIPFGAFIVPALQRFTASFSVLGLELLNIPVYANGFIIEIPEGSFEVAEACAGLRFLIASIVFGCFFATIMYRSPIRRMVFIGLSIVVPIVANGVRALGIIMIGHLSGSASAAATDHVLYGWIFFSLVTLLLVAVGMTFAEPPEPISTGAMPTVPSSKARIMGTMAGGLLLTLMGPAYLMMIERASAEPVVSSFLTQPADDWAREPNAKISWLPITHGTDQVSLVTYRQNEIEVTQFIALYPLPSRGSPFTSTINSVADPETWRVMDAATKTISRAGLAPLVVRTTMIEGRSTPRLVWSFYVVDDQTTTSILEAKLLQARAALFGGRHVGAFVAISTEAQDIQAANAALTRFVDAMAPWRDLHRARIGW